jgi:hypothetical protein
MVKSVLQKNTTPYIATTFIYQKWVKHNTVLRREQCFGTGEHMLPLFGIACYTYFEISKKMKTKNSHVRLHVLHACVACVKKHNSMLKIRLFRK